jgi:bifunctional UDP-N-acetylglucosamine pyrophosphorylase/glucosamine-1-phosphate N-acetyltransferase
MSTAPSASLLELNIVILAAGKGTRMFSDTPKVLQEVAGSFLLTHVLACAQQLEPTKIVVVYGFGGNAVPQAINNPNLIWVEQEKQLGTGHAVQQALPYLDDNSITLVLLGDVPLLSFASCHHLIEQATDQLVLFTVEKPDPTGYGRILRNPNGSVSAIVEEKDASNEQRAIREVNSGIMAMPTRHLKTWLAQLRNDNAQAEYYLTDIIAMAVSNETKVVTHLAQDEWEVMGINTKQDLAAVERVYQQRQAMELMRSGVTLRDPARLDVRGRLVAGRDVSIDVGCVFQGNVELGDGVNIGAYCVIKDAVIGMGSVVAPFTHIDGAKTGAQNRIGPFARLRPGTELANEVHIGNFVEIKNSQVNTESKINHLSYVGDSTVGKRVNIGAGTITCNYDGVNKHRTVIGDDVFVGSNAQLVAPVSLGTGATIGAGSTITKDAPEGALTLARARQITLNNWKRPEKKK